MRETVAIGAATLGSSPALRLQPATLT